LKLVRSETLVDGDDTIYLEPSVKEGLLAKITVSRRVPNWKQYMRRTGAEADGTFTIGFGAPPFVDELIELLKYIESFGSFRLNIRRVHWEDPTLEWLPDDPEEAAAVPTASISFGYHFSDPVALYRPDMLRDLLRSRKNHEHLVIPMSFFREGLNEHLSKRFVAAFYNFYFFIEGLYSDGHTKNRRVLEAFLESQDLMRAAADIVTLFNGNTIPAYHRRQLAEWLAMRGLQLNASGLMELLVWMRGSLFHFSIRSTTPKAHPINQRHFETLSFIGLNLCDRVIVYLLTGAGSVGDPDGSHGDDGG
jgi:hypothetical protein